MSGYDSLVRDLFELWTRPPGADPAAVEARFGAVYTDPVQVNGAALSVAQIADRARSVHRAFSDLRVDLIEQVEQGDKLIVVFRQTSRHTGPLATVLGEVPATGRRIDGLGIDVLTVTGGRISQIWVLADELQRLVQMGAVALATPPGSAEGQSGT
jgi:predicted ester cyclase